MKKPYDAKSNQECKICGYSFSHNKQGRFTSHLLKNHSLNLESYLIEFYYKEKELICSYELCNNKVGLRRGIPKLHCSRSCSTKGKPLECLVCSSKFEASNRQTKTCSKKCAKTLKSQKVAEWHKKMPIDIKNEHFNSIIKKTSATRRQNNTPSWNSGKTGVYSRETIEKIRAATLRQMEDQVFKKTKIEKIMEKFLQDQHIDYQYSFILEKRQFDFLLKDYGLIIECDGDYWHANPKFYPKPEEWQLRRIKIDKNKNNIAIKNGYRIVRFWEDDILNNFNKVHCVINDLLATT
ncbi:endonuclease domain-containing protein [Sutcliffiella horikoshii]|uniref:endonuclease domain-containing protein n=1 Tax=Sutcliffiella horikoshii TaxID=79883 RepID=UPI00203C40C5|nr:DUF559 domain-containing protein [Sutcliffiella horikoshii]MCM3617749.1 endonuclease domain-containing protein [Sutcliffiella horikoshii]